MTSPNVQPFDPSNQHRIIRDRLHTLDMITERFSQRFRLAMFNYLKRNPDIRVKDTQFISFANFTNSIPTPSAINMVNIKPLTGSSLIVFSYDMIFSIVDTIFGGEGKFPYRNENRGFTTTEERIINKLLTLFIHDFDASWDGTYETSTVFNRLETEAKFANITNSPNDIVVVTTFTIDLFGKQSEFYICIPYVTLEPIKEILIDPVIDGQVIDYEGFKNRMTGEVKKSDVVLTADFVSIQMKMRDVNNLEVGDIIPIDIPESVKAKVDGVPVMKCSFGSKRGAKALSVIDMINHGAGHLPMSKVLAEAAKEQNNNETDNV